jgi:hypothetical protein
MIGSRFDLAIVPLRPQIVGFALAVAGAVRYSYRILRAAPGFELRTF